MLTTKRLGAAALYHEIEAVDYATGEVVIASRTGSQVAPYAYSARNVIWVIGAQKIVPTLEEALQRVRMHAFALEDERMKQTGAEGTSIGKILIVENEWRAGRVSIIIVRELLGF